jgi:hypothetical protein
MPGERQLGHRGEDAQAVVRLGIARGQYERGLRQVHPVSQALHLLAFQALAVEYHGHRIAAVGRGREDVDERKLALGSCHGLHRA